MHQFEGFGPRRVFDVDPPRYLGRQQGNRNRARTQPRGRSPYNGARTYGYAYVHTVLDDHSRVAYAEVHDDEPAPTAAAPEPPAGPRLPGAPAEGWAAVARLALGAASLSSTQPGSLT